MKWYILNYRNLTAAGFAIYQTASAKLLMTMRGCCMIDVFDLKACVHVAYLDFDMQRDVILAHVFGSPVIGLPFTAQMRQAFGQIVLPFEDLRSSHDVGLYVQKPYRNKGAKGIWNLDEILMAVAMATAIEHGVPVFTVKPTGDRARYYRRKFGAKTWPTTASEPIVAIDLKAGMPKLQHIEFVEINGQTHFFKVKRN
jgi:hypothetical protein